MSLRPSVRIERGVGGSTADPAPKRTRGGPVRRIGLIALALLLMLGGAGVLMVRFVGSRPAAVDASAARAHEMATGGGLVIPVAGVRRVDLIDTWGQSRENGTRPHQGTDIMAPGGTAVLAAAAGTVEKLFDSRAGGRTLYVRSADRRWSYYYAHLTGYAPNIAEGSVIRAGRTIGYVGDTGNAGAGNHHLHFGVSRMRPEEHWWAGEPVNPYPLLVGDQAER